MARPRSIDPHAKKSRTVVLGIRFSERQMTALRRLAKARGVSVAELVRSVSVAVATKKSKARAA